MTTFNELRIFADGDWRVVGAEHDIVTELHTAAGAEAWDVLGASQPDTLAWLAATASPGAAAALLRTDDDGKVALEGLAVGRVGSSLIPALADTYDVGSSLLWWREGYISQLNAVVFAEEQISLMGGWLMVPPDAGNLAGDVAPADTEVDFGKAMTPGHWILIWAKDAGGNIRKEYLQVGALVSGTMYNVTRDLAAAHGTDPAWSAGTPFCVLGSNGSGRIEINAYDTPRISVVTQGAGYNVQTEVLRLGDLAGIDDPVLSPSGWGLYGQNVFLSGKIVAQTGSMGGWTIASGHLYAGSDGSRAGLQPASYPFYAGSETPASAPFRVTPAGALVATSATITGSITATGGSIAGWTIASGHLYAGSGGSRVGLQPASYPFYAGSEAPASAPFRVTPAGALTATNATVNGTVVAASNTVTLDSNGISIIGGSLSTNRLKFLLGTDEIAYLIGRQESAGYAGFYRAELSVDGDDSSYNAKVVLSAAARTAGDYALLELFGLDGGDSYAQLMLDTGTAYNWYPTHATINGSRDLYIGGGLYVGGTGVDPAMGDITATGTITGNIVKSDDYMVAVGGLRVGSSTDPGTNNLSVAGRATVASYLGVTDYVYALGGVHVGGSSDPGTDNLVVDGASSFGGNVNVSGRILMNCTASNFNSVGLTIDQATSDDDAITLKSYGDVLHGMTTWADTSTYGFFRKQDGAYGGLMMAGLRDGGTALAMNIFGFLNGTPATTKSAASFGVCHIGSAVQSGTTIGACGNNSNLLSIANYSNTRFIFDADGDLHLDSLTVVNAWDEYDDMALLTGLRAAAAPALRERFGQFIEQARPVLEATGVATFNEDGTVWYGVRALQMLTIDALRQFAVRTEARLERYERELLRLGVDPAKLIA